MTDLILHIGMPKTATTTLQKTVLSKQTTFIGKHKKALPSFETDIRRLDQLVRSSLFQDKSTLKRKAEEWGSCFFNRLVSIFPDIKDFPSSIILSEENLVRWPDSSQNDSWPFLSNMPAPIETRNRPAPIVRFLRDYGSVIWPHGRIRILLTIRNQADWLASLYSQDSFRLWNASQADFEERTQHLLEMDDPFLNWKAWTDDLESIVGHGNLKVLPMERISEPCFAAEISKFLALEPFVVESLPSSSFLKYNMRNEDTSSHWPIRPPRLIKTWRSEGKLPRLMRNGVIVKGLRKIEGPIIRPVWRLFADRQRETQFELREDLQFSILEHFGERNAQLSEKLSCSLEGLGYWPERNSPAENM